VYKLEINMIKSTKSHADLKSSENDAILAAKSGNNVWLKQIIDLHPEHCDLQNSKGYSPFHFAALRNNLEALQILFESSKTIDIDQSTTYGWTACHLCINNKTKKKSLKCLKYLHQKGINLDRSTDLGLTPMHLAATTGNVIVLEYLMSNNNTPSPLESRGLSPHDLAVLWGHREAARVIAHYVWIRRSKSKKQIDNITKTMEKLTNEKDSETLKDNKEQKIDADFSFNKLIVENNSHYDITMLPTTDR